MCATRVLLHDANVLYAFAALAGTALLAGLCVAVRRISPLAAGLPGLVLIAWTIVYGYPESTPTSLLATEWDKTAPYPTTSDDPSTN